MNRFFFSIALVLFIYCAGVAIAQNPQSVPRLSPEVITGILPNGMTYFIQKNAKPENRVSLRLVVRAGSVQETDRQRGIAHLLEHMEFQGTEHFGPQEIVNFLEKNGMRFGGDLNAYTTLTNTVYFFELPTDVQGNLTTGLRILNDWAHGPKIDPALLTKEEKVVVEENRERSENVRGRTINYRFPIAFQNSPYENRQPIGKMDQVTTFSAKDVMDFCEAWYHPASMAVVVVGDIDPVEAERQIKANFSDKFRPTAVNSGRNPSIPPYAKTASHFFKDKDLRENQIDWLQIQQVSLDDPAQLMKLQALDWVMTTTANKRFSEMSQAADAVFRDSGIGTDFLPGASYLRDFIVVPLQGKVLPALDAFAREIRRYQTQGFSQRELGLALDEYNSANEAEYKQRTSTTHGQRADAITEYFLEGMPYLSDETLYNTKKTIGQSLTLKDLNNFAASQWKLTNYPIIVEAIDKTGNEIPTASEVERTLNAALTAEVAARVEKKAVDLDPKVPQAGAIVKTSDLPSGIVSWELSNGVKVLLKKNDLTKNEILLKAFAPGGLNSVEDKDYINAELSTDLFANTGVANLDMSQLNDFLYGKQCQVNLDVQANFALVNASAIPKDLDTMFRLLYWKLSGPRRDSALEANYRDLAIDRVRTRQDLPDTLFGNEVRRVNMGGHLRSKPVTSETYKALDFNAAERLYRGFFGNASNFTFVITGDFDETTMKKLVGTWIASLPTGKTTAYRDLGIRPFKGPLKSVIAKGNDNKSEVVMALYFDRPWNRADRFAANILREVLDIRMREVLRGDKNGVYGADVSMDWGAIPAGYFRVDVDFTCDPGRRDELIQAATGVLKELASGKIEKATFDKAVETNVRDIEVGQKTNQAWAGRLFYYTYSGIDFGDIAKLQDFYRATTLNQVAALAAEVLKTEGLLAVIHDPEKK